MVKLIIGITVVLLYVRKGSDSSVLVHGQVVNIHEHVCACM